MRTYSSKLLLFGEYAIINGGNGLAVPLSSFHAQWTHYNIYSVSAENSRRSLYALYNYIAENKAVFKNCNLEQFKKDLDKGIWIDSNIPQGYGLGSSGAISAAVYDRYFEKGKDLKAIKTDLANIEACFHGKSSGLDPIVAFTEASILVKSNLPQIVESYQAAAVNIYLLDTEKARNSTPLIAEYLAKRENKDFSNALEAYQLYNDACIEAFLQGEKEKLQTALYNLSQWQAKYFDFLIPSKVLPFWESALAQKNYILKLCGAGGGGYMLIFEFEKHSALEDLKSIFPIQKVK